MRDDLLLDNYREQQEYYGASDGREAIFHLIRTDEMNFLKKEKE